MGGLCVAEDEVLTQVEHKETRLRADTYHEASAQHVRKSAPDYRVPDISLVVGMRLR